MERQFKQAHRDVDMVPVYEEKLFNLDGEIQVLKVFTSFVINRKSIQLKVALRNAKETLASKDERLEHLKDKIVENDIKTTKLKSKLNKYDRDAHSIELRLRQNGVDGLVIGFDENISKFRLEHFSDSNIEQLTARLSLAVERAELAEKNEAQLKEKVEKLEEELEGDSKANAQVQSDIQQIILDIENVGF